MQQALFFNNLLVILISRFRLVESAGPIWNEKLGLQQIPICSPGKSIHISLNAVTDVEDGNNLQLQLLNSFNEIIPNELSSYIYLNTVTRILYILPIIRYTKEISISYKLRATDKDLNFSDDNFTIQYIGTIADPNVLYEFTFTDVSNGVNSVQSFYEFLGRIGTFWNSNSTAAYSLVGSQGTNIVKVLECNYFSLSGDRCPLSDLMVRSYHVISNDRNGCPFLLNSTTTTTFSRVFTQAMETRFSVTEYKAEKLRVCTTVQTTTPFIQPQYIVSPTESPMISLTGVFQYEIPNELVVTEVETDQAEGLAGLCAFMTDQYGQYYPTTAYWLGVEIVAPASKRLVYVIHMDETLDDVFRTGFNKTQEGFTYSRNQLNLINDVGKDVFSSYLLKINSTVVRRDYTCTFTFKCIGIAYNVYALQIKYFLEFMYQSFGDVYKNKLYMRNYKLSSYDEKNATGSLQWSLIMEKCDYTLIEHVRSKMFVNKQDGVVNTIFKQLFTTKFEIYTILDSLTGHCDKNPPYVNKPLQPLPISYCGVFRYMIPTETFYDQEDGATDEMTLKLLKLDGSAIAKTDNIQFLVKEQTIIGVLSSKTTFSTSDLEYNLVVTDSSGLTAETKVEIKVIDTPQTVPYEFHIATKYTPLIGDENINAAYVIASKVGRYFGDMGAGFLLVEHSVTSASEEFFMFGNCTWRKTPCDVYKLKAYKEKMLNENNILRTEFLQGLQPEFETPSYDAHKANPPCDADLRPNLVNPWGPLDVTTCSTFKQKIPENTFYDIEQGDTRSLTCSVVQQNGNALLEHSFVSFDVLTQEITILATQESPESIEFKLVAKDLILNEETQQLIINVGKQSTTPSHLVTMEITQLPTTKTNLVAVGEYIRTTFMQYFNDEVTSKNTFDIQSFTTVVNGFTSSSVYRMKWSNCTISTTVCDEIKINSFKDNLVTGTEQSLTLKNFLEDKFTIQSIEVTYSGVCEQEKKIPVVLNPIADLSMTFCGYMKFQIPDDTFDDDIDGSTRQLQVSMTTTDGSALDESSWIQFDEGEQQIYGIASHLDTRIDEAQTYTFQLTATTQRGLSVSTNVNIKIVKDRKQVSYAFDTVNLKISADASNLKTITKFIDQLASFYQKSSNDLYNYEYGFEEDGGVLAYYFTTCTARYDPCDRELISSLNEISEEKGQPSSAISTALGPDFYIIKFTGNILNEICKPQITIPPVCVKSFEPFKLDECGAFKVAFSEKTFVDEEDNTNLDLLITHINDEAFNQNSKWIKLDQYYFAGIVPQYLYTGESSQLFKVTVRATDSDDLYVTCDAMVTVKYRPLTTFYEYELQVTQTQNNNDDVLQDKIDISNILNNYLNGKVTSIITCSRNNDIITVKWKHCGLPDKCDNNMITQINNKLFTNNNEPREDLITAFQPNFQVESLKFYQQDSCVEPQNPPTALMDPYAVTLPICGGFDKSIPESLFSDIEDGNTRKLQLTLTTQTGGVVASEFPWFYFDATSQRLYGYPTLFQANQFTARNIKLKLTATDLSGLSVTIDMPLSFDTPAIDPKYFIRFHFETESTEESMLYDFLGKIASYSSESNIKSIGLKDMQLVGGKSITYYNCTVSYEPCNWAILQQITNTFKTLEDKPTDTFSNHMEPDYNMLYVTVSADDECSSTIPDPPIVVNKIVIPPLFMCSAVVTQVIPSNTFYDNQDGGTNNLKLTLTNNENKDYDWLSMKGTQEHILQFILHSHTIQNQPTDGYIFTLAATDSQQLSTSFDFNVNTYGPYSLLDECQIQMELKSQNQLLADSQAYQFSVLKKLQQYFQLDTITEIGIVEAFMKDSYTMVFHWSYCSASYKTEEYKTNSQMLKVDYYNFISKIIMKLFKSDRKTLQEGFLTTVITSLGFTLQSFKTQFTGRCANLPPIVPPNIPSISITIDYGGYARYFIQGSTFYDFEDGSAYDLTLQVTSATGVFVNIDSWLNIDITTYNIFAVVNDYIRFLKTTTFTFYLQATDSGGLFTSLTITVIKTGNVYQFAPFNITYQLTYGYNGGYNLVYANQSSYLINIIQNYFQITNLNHILMRWYFKGNGMNSRYMTWSIAEHTCSSTVLETVKTLSSQTGVLNTAFVNTFGNVLTIKRLYYFTTCLPVIEPPIPINPINPPKIRFCTLFTYQLSSNLFFDGYDGELPNLQLTLLDSAGTAVSFSSWLQVDSVTMQLYAIAIRSVYRISTSYQYSLQATNSRGLSKTISFTTEFETTPYTSDCPITMTFRYKFFASTSVNLDILWQLIEMIRNYYQDKDMYIKVLTFVRTESTFTIQWSNCSSYFQFSSQTSANVGMTEAARSTIESIFSKVVSRSSIVTTNFQSYISTYFEVITISASYCCIEQPPVSNIQELRASAYFCRGFYEKIPSDAFYDECDGNTDNLKLTLHYENGDDVDINNWLQIDNENKVIYGVLTETIRSNAPIQGYKYLVKATDHTGRSSTFTYIVNVISPAVQYTKLFYFGFYNHYDSQTPTAKLLYDTKSTLQTLLNEDIYIDSFIAPGFIKWTPCSQLTCDLVNLQYVLKGLQVSVYDYQPNQNFINNMKPSITPYYIQVFAITDKCIEKNITIIVNPPPPIIPVPTCGNFTYTISNNLFYDAYDRKTQDFIVKMKTVNSQLIPSYSWIQYDTTQQRVYGVVVMSQMSAVMNYQLEAVHPVSAYTATTSITINYPTYTNYQQYNNTICKVTTTVSSSYRTTYRDVTILRLFLNFMASYLQVSTSQILIISYTKTTTYPSVWVITWTNCESLTIIQTSSIKYFQNLQAFFSSLFVYSSSGISSTNQKVYEFFQQNSYFTMVTITTTTECDKPPNTSPRVNNQIPEQDMGCGVFELEVPDDAFLDEQQGNTRNLRLELTNMDRSVLDVEFSWIALNSSQFILAIPTNATITDKPVEGYKFLLTAYDEEGLSASMTIRISFEKSQLIFLPYTEGRFIIAGTNNLLSPYRIEDKIKLLKAVAPSDVYYPLGMLSYKRLEFVDGSIFFGNTFTVKITHCECDPYEGFTFETVNTQAVITSAAPAFDIALMQVTRDQQACQSYLGDPKPLDIALTYCTTYLYNITVENQVPMELLNKEIKVLLKDQNENDLPQDSWIWYNYDLKVIEFFPKESFWLANQDMSFNYTLWYEEEENTDPERSLFILIVYLPTVGRADGLKYDMTFSIQGTQTQHDNYYISSVLHDLQSLLPKYNISFSNLQKLQTEPFKFTITWRICLSEEICNDINAILFDQNGIKPKVRSLLKFTIETINSECIDDSPQVPKHLNLTIHTCGVFEYQLPDTFAYDTQDGDLRSLSVTLTDMTGEIVTSTSWIQFENYKFHAIPTEIVVNSLVSDDAQYQLVFKDSGGKVNKTTVFIQLIQDGNQYYKVSFVFNTLTSTSQMAWVKLQMMFLEYLSQVTKDNTLEYYRLLEFQKYSSNRYYMQIANCTIQNIVCQKEDDILQQNEQKMRNGDGSFTTEFQQAIQSSFTGVSIQTSSFYQVNTAPIIIKEIGTIQLESCCSMKKICIANTYFSDEDSRMGKNLTFHLKTSTGVLVTSQSFVQLVNNCIYILPTGKVEGLYTYILTAIDSCGEESNMQLQIQFEESCQIKFGYNSRIIFDLDVSQNLYEVLFNIWQVISNYFHDNNLSLVSYSSVDSNYIVSFSNCSIPYPPCMYKEVQEISNKMNEIDLKQKLETIVKVISVNETREEDCKEKPPQPPQTNITKLIYNITFCTKVDWKLNDNIFYGENGETTRNYLLTLLDENKQVISTTNWLQLETTTQRLYGYTKVSSTTNIKRRYVYYIRASSSTGIFKDLEMCVYIHDETPDLDYRLTVKGAINGNIGNPNVYYELLLLTKLATFFDDTELNSVSFTRDETFKSNFQFEWSFCSMRDQPCDCMFVQTTQDRIKQNNFKETFGSEFAIQDVSYKLYDDCAKTQSPQLTNSKVSTITINIGQPFKQTIPSNTFTDAEDGNTNDLTLCIRDEKGVDLSYDSWLRLNDLSICGLYTVFDFQQQNSVTQRVYDLVAKDNCGKEASDSFTVNFIQTLFTWKYSYYMLLDIPYGEFSTNCTLMEDFFQLIQGYTSMNTMYLISVKPHVNNTANQTEIEWTFENTTETICDGNQILEITTKTVRNIINGSFVTYVKQKNYPVTNTLLRCKQTSRTTEKPTEKKDDFDWWWVIVLGAILFIIFLLWLLWICIPRCCPACCKGRGVCCEKCCLPGGGCASYDKPDGDVMGRGTDDKIDAGSGFVSPVPSVNSATILLPGQGGTSPRGGSSQHSTPSYTGSGKAPKPLDASSLDPSSPSSSDKLPLPRDDKSPIPLPPFYHHHEMHRHSTDQTHIDTHSLHTENISTTNVLDRNVTNITEYNTNVTDHTHERNNNQLALPSIESWKDPRNSTGGNKFVRKIYYDDDRHHHYDKYTSNQTDNRKVVKKYRDDRYYLDQPREIYSTDEYRDDRYYLDQPKEIPRTDKYHDDRYYLDQPREIHRTDEYLDDRYYLDQPREIPTTDEELYVVQRSHSHKHHNLREDDNKSKKLVLVKDNHGFTTSTATTDRSEESVTLTIPKHVLESYLEKRWRENKHRVKIHRKTRQNKTEDIHESSKDNLVVESHVNHHRYRNNHPMEYEIGEASHLTDALVDDQVIVPRRPVLERSTSHDSITDAYHRHHSHHRRPKRIQYVYRKRRKSPWRQEQSTSSSSQSYVLVPHERGSNHKRKLIRTSRNLMFDRELGDVSLA